MFGWELLALAYLASLFLRSIVWASWSTLSAFFEGAVGLRVLVEFGFILLVLFWFWEGLEGARVWLL